MDKSIISCFRWGNNQITTSMICGGFLQNPNRGTCQGDSGGPVICNENGKAIITGIVSYGTTRCNEALTQIPKVYARVTRVLDWIKSNMVRFFILKAHKNPKILLIRNSKAAQEQLNRNKKATKRQLNGNLEATKRQLKHN